MRRTAARPPRWKPNTLKEAPGLSGAWIEVVEYEPTGPDYGWPEQGDRFAYLGENPPGLLTWLGVIEEWSDAGPADGEGEEGCWARTYLTAQQLRLFLSVAFGASGSVSRSLADRINPDGRYIVTAVEQPRLFGMGQD